MRPILKAVDINMENLEHANSLIWEVTIWEFLFVTVILGGGAAFLTGRATASVWLARRQLVIYIVLLTCAVRFIHFALFSGTLLSLHYYIVDLIVLLIIAFAGRRLMRASQMATQYSFAFSRSGAFGWKRRN